MAPANVAPAFTLGLGEPGLAVVRSLARTGAPVVGFEPDPRAPGLRSRCCTPRRCPDPLHPETDAELIALLRAEAARFRERPVLLPTTDAFFDLVARHAAELAPEFRFVLPPPEVARAMTDKRAQYELADRFGMPCPRSLYPRDVREARALAPSLAYPVLLKPYRGHLWRERFRFGVAKGFKAESPAELVERFELAAAAGYPVLVQEIVAGPVTEQVEVCAYLGADGAVLGVLTARKLRQHPPEFGVGTLVETTDEPELAGLAVRFLRDLRYRGFANVELKRDSRDGRWKLIEVNARFHLQTALAVDAGVDFPRIAWLDARGTPPPPAPAGRAGVRWLNLRGDVRTFLALRRAGGLGALGWVRSCVGARSFALASLTDPLPLAYTYASRLTTAAALGASDTAAPAPARPDEARAPPARAARR